MEREGPFSGQRHPTRLLHLARGEIEDLRARAQGLPEGVLLGVGDGRDPLPVGVERLVGLAHLVAAQGHQLGQHAILDPEQPHRAHRATQQPAQDVAAALVAGRHAVPDQHHPAAHVVGDDPEAHVVEVVGAVAPAGELLGALDDREHHVDLVHVRLVLEQVGDPLEAQPGVDVAGRQRPHHVEVLLAADGAELLLHEHQVPELHVAVACVPVAVLAECRSAVDEDLRRRTAGPGNTHAPVVVLGPEPHDPVVGQTGLLLPQRHGLVVVGVDAGVEDRLVEAEASVGLGAGDQVPREPDRPLLEVVAEGEVAAHLEERAVTGGLADLFDVEGPHALLHAHGPVVRRHLLTQEVGLEGHHAGIDEEQVGVVEQQGR